MQGDFQYDRIGIAMINELGEETLMWECDYPTRWPDSTNSRSAICLPSHFT
jgi:hypothetical protein